MGRAVVHYLPLNSQDVMSFCCLDTDNNVHGRHWGGTLDSPFKEIRAEGLSRIQCFNRLLIPECLFLGSKFNVGEQYETVNNLIILRAMKELLDDLCNRISLGMPRQLTDIQVHQTND